MAATACIAAAQTAIGSLCLLSGAERSSAVSYVDVGERPVHVVTPLVAVLAVVNAFVMALLAVAFITNTGNRRTGGRVQTYLQ